MKRKILFAAVAALTAMSSPLFAGDAKIMIHDPYARASGPSAKAGAAFMEVMNMGSEPDRLIAATSEISKVTQLHTHQEDGDGVMKMIHVEEGFEIPAGETLMLMRGGKHVMFMGLNDPMEQGETVKVTLTFEKAGDIEVEIPVDLERKAETGHSHSDHSSHGSHSN